MKESPYQSPGSQVVQKTLKDIRLERFAISTNNRLLRYYIWLSWLLYAANSIAAM